MRLSLSLGIWLVALAAAVVGISGWLQMRAEAADLERAARRELKILTTAIRTAVENAIRDGQDPDVVGLIERLEIEDPVVDIFVIAADRSVLGSSSGSEPNLSKAKQLASDNEHMLVRELDGREFAAVTPLRVEGRVVGHVVVFRPGDLLNRELAAERLAIVQSIGLIVVALAAGIYGVVRVGVHRPLSRVLLAIERVKGGLPAPPLVVPGKGEIAELAREFNAMAQSLRESSAKLAAETEARQTLEREMLHANRMAIVGQLAASLAHEVGSPLQVLHGRARDLATRKELPADVARTATILVQQTERVQQIVERLLDVARRRLPDLQRLQLNEPLQDVLELIGTAARRKGVALDVEVHPFPPVRGDRSQLQQVFLNLLQNALTATERGGAIRVVLSSSSFQRSGRSGRVPSASVLVEDDGCGLPEGLGDDAFEPFVTRWPSGASQKGTGLGLAVVKSVVTEHGGSVEASAGPSGRGARFVVHLPAET